MICIRVGWPVVCSHLGGVTKNKGTNKQNAKHAYIEQQIHSSNFTLTRISGYLNYVYNLAKKSPFSSYRGLRFSDPYKSHDHISLTPLFHLIMQNT